jgi:prophage regulatory protein
MAAQLAEDLARNGLYGITADGRVIGHIDAFLRLDAVKRATGLSTSTIYELMEAGLFPKAVKLVPGSDRQQGKVGWVASEVAKFQRERIAARDASR